ncbi:MAG: T9SS type A sorting domain-containing protein [Flavobacteriaceae bacterium]|nr:T9SS type A sorting domain-containing protein [Flavobacteriaceae bacterium]
MKKRLLTLGTLAISFFASAQEFLTTVKEDAEVNIMEGALVYNGGGMKIVGSGVVDNKGNVMIVGDANSKFATVTSASANKTTGGNFILRMTNETVAQLRYGQLYIKGLNQANITGIVDKEYKDVAHGTYQQIALPFCDKGLSTLDTELGKTFSNNRWTQDEILVWNNKVVRFDLLKKEQTTANANRDDAGRKAKTAYFAIGSKGFNASTGKKTLKGIPYADNVSETLNGAGDNIQFGSKGERTNYYRERYNSYLQDSFDYPTGQWQGNYGKNIYQFGNPFLTNLDLGHLKILYGEKLQGVRVEPTGVTTREGSTYSTGAKYITYSTTGVPVGDALSIIKPMQTFVVKLTSGEPSQALVFDDLRRFAYTSRPADVPYSVTAQSLDAGGLQTMESISRPSTVKQLGVIALDKNGEELGRTYYVVHNSAVSGKPEKPSTQVIAGRNIIGTFEEAKEGGVDESLKNSYWLYINEANEDDFKGKEVPLRIYSEDVKSLKFEILEDARSIANKQETLSSGESFYINTGKELLAIGNKETLALSSSKLPFGLFYGRPEFVEPELKEVELEEKPSATFIAYNNATESYEVVFDLTWKTAFIQIFDMTGRAITTQKNVDTTKNYIVDLPVRGTYVVTAISDTGKKFSQKIVK